MNHVALLLKQGKDGLQAESYRPITTGSLLSQLHWGIINHKLATV